MIVTHKGLTSTAKASTIRSMFEARKEVFVDLLKWDVPVLDDRFEIDQFDDQHATYLIVANEQGVHLGSARLLSTEKPHILGDLFSHLCAGEVPKGDGIAEITRFCLGRNQTAASRRLVRDSLLSALVRHALASGINTYTGVADLGWLQQILAFGWNCRPLGTPRRVNGAMIGALAIDIDAQTQTLLTANGIWVGEEDRAEAPVLEAA